MSKRRYVLTFITLFLLPLMLVHFQNCAPATPPQGANSTNPDSNGHVGLVDNLDKSQIQFVTSEAQIQDEAAVADISGLCARDRDGAALKWTVWDANNSQQVIAKGLSRCDHGRFSVDIEQLDQYVCGVNHLLVVEGDWGASTYAHFSRRCQPLISMDEETPVGMPYGTNCSIEYSPASAAEQPCLRVCYRNNQVVMSQPLDVSQCSSLAASFSWPLAWSR